MIQYYKIVSAAESWYCRDGWKFCIEAKQNVDILFDELKNTLKIDLIEYKNKQEDGKW